MNTQTNESIIEQWLLLHSQRGDKKALKLLIERLHPLMVRHARRILGDDPQLEDVVQEAWCALVKNLNKVKDPAKIRAFVLKIVAHKANDALRKIVRRRRYISEPSRDDTGHGDIGHDDVGHEYGETPQPIEEQHPLLGPLQQALKSLPKDQALIIAMHYLEELALDDIAMSLNIPIGTAKSRLFTARNRLKTYLETHHEHH